MRVYKYILGTLITCMMMFFIAGCGEEYIVTIQDMGKTTEVVVTSGQKVEAVLEDAGIVLGEKDEVSPGLNEKIKEDTDVEVRRYAAVTVIDVENKEHPVELVGGTVGDAIEESGLVLTGGQSLDIDEDTYLENGMVITILQAASVTLTADGETSDVYTNAETVEAFLKEQNITIGEHDRVTPELTYAIESGMEIVLQRVEVKEETVIESIDYETETQKSSSLPSGETETKQEGINGEKEVTYRVTYVDGAEESREVIRENITKEAVKEIIVKGTKKSSDSSSNQSSGGKEIVDIRYYDDCDGSGHGVKVITYSDGSTEEVEY